MLREENKEGSRDAGGWDLHLSVDESEHVNCWVMSNSLDSQSNPVDCSPPGSSDRGILQARILEWVAISSSRGSSQPGDQTRVSFLAGGFFTTEPPGAKL